MKDLPMVCLRQDGNQAFSRSSIEEKTNKAIGQKNKKAKLIKMKQIVIELTNMPVLVLEIPVSKLVEKPDPKSLDTRSSFLDIIEIILKMIVDGAKAIFPKRKEKN